MAGELESTLAVGVDADHGATEVWSAEMIGLADQCVTYADL
jgi:hypothetical protein